MAFPTISMNPPFTHLNSTEENPLAAALPSAPMMENVSATIQNGVNALQETSSDSGTPSSLRSEISSATPLSNLRSNAKVSEILERVPVLPRALRVTNADVAALCQVITEFKEQFIEY
jgi:hypothetical protein